MEGCLATRKAYSCSSPVWSLGQTNLNSILNMSRTSCAQSSYLLTKDNDIYSGWSVERTKHIKKWIKALNIGSGTELLLTIASLIIL